VRPDDAQISQAAQLLAGAKKPVIITGDGVAYSGAQHELARFAETIGAEVWEADAGEVNIDYSHPLHQGMTGHMFGPNSLPIMQKGDVVFAVGTYLLPEVFPELGEIFAPEAKVIHLDLDVYEIAKNHRVDLPLMGDPKTTLPVLSAALDQVLSAEQKDAAKQRVRQSGEAKEKKRQAEFEKDKAGRDATPLRMSRFMEELAEQLPKDAVIFDEALTSSPPVVRYRPPSTTNEYFLTRGGSLGVGIPGAIGAKVAHPDRTVIGFTGDGGSMYTIQALWTAARHNIDAKFVVCNNGSYRLLQLNIEQYWKEQNVERHDYPLAFDLSHPPLHFVDMARGMGVAGVRVEKPWEVGPAIKQMLAHPGPFLIDLVLEGDTHPERVGNTCGQ
jgi:thiamine pyrophosphate-dependent acetolactate synthase large subunit-like protein